ncbi:SRPBCC family protein [Cellulomonas sp. NS3]|uniref:SRPBCC family protein n=1 Tax=Cellulomonas sp. NS3 TaxID=2973977 RepID=UPI002161A784|nr:SRPBCC domain-containing protein [Cellulomonas sp. NS3]
MVDILHRVGAVTPTTAAVYDALTRVDALAAWWTEDTQGSGDAIGDTLAFRFPAGGFDMEVVDLVPSERVVWRVVDGPEEWVGTTVEWDLRQEGEHAIVLFAHRGWREPVEFMHHCSTKWASFLLSLKALVETGAGAPAPRDVRIDNWN